MAGPAARARQAGAGVPAPGSPGELRDAAQRLPGEPYELSHAEPFPGFTARVIAAAERRIGEPVPGDTLDAQARRVGDAKYWRRFLVKRVRQARELLHIQLGLVGGAAFKGSAKPAADGDASAQDLSRDFSGSVMLASGGALQTLSVSTPNTLVEKTSASGVVTPVRGVVNTASAERKVATSATLNGATLTIGADTNGDGLWDAVFDMSWASLGL